MRGRPVGVAVYWKHGFIVRYIQQNGDTHLFHVGVAHRFFAARFGLGEGGQKQGCKNSNDGHHHQQLNQGESNRITPSPAKQNHPKPFADTEARPIPFSLCCRLTESWYRL